MQSPIPQFRCKEDKGHLIFVIPFSFVSEQGEAPTLCEQYFQGIKQEEEKSLQAKDKGSIKDIYEKRKEDLCKRLRADQSGLFDAKHSLDEWTHCSFCKKNSYTGRNLCSCLSISRRFHDDSSQFNPRIEIFLGGYDIHYDDTRMKKHFHFQMASTLLLNGKSGSECGYVMYVIPLASINEDCFGAETGNELDNIIFLKHLFYKQRLHCSINKSEPISLQKWTEQYVSTLLPVLGIADYKKACNGNFLFNYSMIELNNIVDERGEIISMANAKQFMQTYHKQLYGILVSDEGWQNTPDEEIKSLFGHNYWTSRDYNCAICLNHNAIVINQYKSTECAYNREYAVKWMSHYGDHGNDLSFYKQYISLEPCIPGVSTLTFEAYLGVVCKDLRIGIAKTRTEGNKETLENRYKYLANTLQTYSMSLDVIQSLEDMICSQFGLQATLNNLRERYEREANNMQNHGNDMQNERISQLTIITASISIAALLATFMGVILTILDYKKGFVYAIRHSLDVDFLGAHIWYIFGLVGVSVVTIVAVICVYAVVRLVFGRIWKKRLQKNEGKESTL